MKQGMENIMGITWNTDVNAPCCPGEILSDDGQSILVQTDWDFCGAASSFGWNPRAVQCCDNCGHVQADDRRPCDKCGSILQGCIHDGTDGTVDCPCGVTADDFIAAARDWLTAHDGATADDPGYFA